MTIFIPDWSLIVNCIGIFLAVLPLILGVKLSSSKELGLIHWDNATSHERVPDRNDIVKQIHRIQLIWQNHGKEVIFEKDLTKPFEMDLGHSVVISKVTFESNCKFNSLKFEIVGNKILFSFDFLEYNKYIKAELEYFSEEKVAASIKGKIIGGNELDQNIETDSRWYTYFLGKKKADANLFVFPFVAVGLFLTGGFLFLKMFNINPKNLNHTVMEFNKDLVVLILGATCWTGVSIALGIRIRKLFVPFSIYAEKEKNWFLKQEYLSLKYSK